MTDAETSQGTIDEVLARLSATFAARTTHGIDYRTFTLKQLAFLVRDNEDAICAALKADFDRSAAEVRASELWVIYNEVELAVRRLPKWMADEPRDADAILAYRSMAPRVHKQPKGVSLIIGAWNFPFLLTLNPLVGAIAAGCPAVIKPSEHAPASARLLAELIPKYLDADAYAVVLGGAGTAARLLDRQWGHILFTGNGTVGKIVAQAAAKTLTPTTLELGGKSPVIIAADADLEIGVRRMLSMKQYGMGQVCVAADYILCARERVDELTRLCGQVLQEFYPPAPHARSALTGEHTSALRSERDFDRLDAALDDAGAGVVVRGERDRGTRRMGVSVVVLGDDGKSGAGLFAREEIFGPALAVVPVADVDEAIAYVNARPHPLALYVLSRGRATFDKVVEQTTSGSATWNDFGFGTIAAGARTTVSTASARLRTTSRCSRSRCGWSSSSACGTRPTSRRPSSACSPSCSPRARPFRARPRSKPRPAGDAAGRRWRMRRGLSRLSLSPQLPRCGPASGVSISGQCSASNGRDRFRRAFVAC